MGLFRTNLSKLDILTRFLKLYYEKEKHYYGMESENRNMDGLWTWIKQSVLALYLPTTSQLIDFRSACFPRTVGRTCVYNNRKSISKQCPRNKGITKYIPVSERLSQKPILLSFRFNHKKEVICYRMRYVVRNNLPVSNMVSGFATISIITLSKKQIIKIAFISNGWRNCEPILGSQGS